MIIPEFKRESKIPARQYDFNLIIEKINIIGKSYCKDFVIDESNRESVTQLIYYFMNDSKFNGDLTKGLLLRGLVGTGKTILMRVFSEKKPGLNFTLQKNFLFHSVLDVFSEFVSSGFPTIENHSKNKIVPEESSWTNSVCFDELGMESTSAKNYGNSVNVMEMIISKRYNNWQTMGQLTHFTTNLSPDEIEKNYGERIRSRIREMCNDIVLIGKDRRK